MIKVEVTGLDQIGQMQALLQPALFEKAQRGGISYAAKAVPPLVAKGIGAAYNIKAARVKQDISGPRMEQGGMVATLRFSRRPPSLAQFNPNPGRRGPQPGLGRGLGWGPAKPAGKPLAVTIRKGGGRQSIRNAFIAAGANGNRLVFKRQADGALQALYGPSIGSIYGGRSAIGEQLRADVQARIHQQFLVGFQRVLDSASRGYGGGRRG